MRRFFLKNSCWLVYLFTLVLLTIHTFSLWEIKIDNITIALLLILLISPFIPQIRKIKWGDLEAEIDPKQIQKIKDAVEVKIAFKSSEQSKIEGQRILQNLMTMAETDHIMALAKLRIELSQKISKLYQLVVGIKDNREKVSAAEIIHELTLREVLPVDLAYPLKEIIYFCNRAVHGERIQVSDSKKIIEMGVAFYIYINKLIYEYLIKPLETYQVGEDELEKYQNSHYKVVTLIPSAHGGVKNIRVVKKADLDELMEAYGDYPELIVEITAITAEA